MWTDSIKAVIFDLDGVVIDSEVIHGEAKKRVLDDLQIESADEIVNQFKGVSDELFAAHVMQKLPEWSVEQILERKQRYYAVLQTDLKLVVGFREYVSRLHSSGIPMALATSATQDTQRAAFEKFGLDYWFTAVRTAEDVARPKPFPDVYIEAVRAMQLLPQQCLVIEDSINGVRSAVSAGCPTIAFNSSFSTQALTGAGATFVCSGYTELPLPKP